MYFWQIRKGFYKKGLGQVKLDRKGKARGHKLYWK